LAVAFVTTDDNSLARKRFLLDGNDDNPDAGGYQSAEPSSKASSLCEAVLEACGTATRNIRAKNFLALPPS